MILPGAPNPIRNLVDAVLLPRQISLTVVAEVGAVSTALTLVQNGVACSILPSSAIRRRTDISNLKIAQIGPPAMWNSLVLAIPTARPMNRLMQETTNLLRHIKFQTAR